MSIFVREFDRNLGGKMDRNDQDELAGDGEYSSYDSFYDTPEELLMGFNLNRLRNTTPPWDDPWYPDTSEEKEYRSRKTFIDRDAQKDETLRNLRRSMHIAVKEENFDALEHLMRAYESFQ